MTDLAPLPLSPGAAQLAAALSVACRIEPELIRAVRLETFPGLDVGHESELWFSDWIGAREPHAVALRPDVLDELRWDLTGMLARAQPGDPIHRVRHLIEKAHAGLAPTLRLEEEINWLSVSRPGQLDAIDDALEKALRALVESGRGGIADWYLGALGRLPAEARDTRNGWLLATVTAQRYPSAAPVGGMAPDGLGTTHVERIAGQVGQDLLGLGWDGPDLLISGRAEDAQVAVPVPDTDPRVIDVVLGERRETVLVAADATVRVPAGGRAVRLRTATGETFDVAGADQLALVRRLAEEVGPAEFEAIRALLPVPEILDAMVALTPDEGPPPSVFEVRLPAETHRRMTDAFPALARLLRQGHRDALLATGRSGSAEVAIAFLADSSVPDGQFLVRAREQATPSTHVGADPLPGPVDRASAIESVSTRFETWLVERAGEHARQAFQGTPPADLARGLLLAADSSGIRASDTATAGILPNSYQLNLSAFYPFGINSVVSEGLRIAIRNFAELRGHNIYGAGEAQIQLVGRGTGITCDFVDEAEAPLLDIGWIPPIHQPRLVGRQGKQTLLEPGRTIIGRGSTAGIRLDDQWIDDEHAVVQVEPNGVSVQLLSRANGIMVNGRAVDAAQLIDGDRIALGGSELTFRWVQAQPDPGQPAYTRTPVEVTVSPRRPGLSALPSVPFERRALRRGYAIRQVDRFLDRVQRWLNGEPGQARVTAQNVHDVVFQQRFGGYDEWQVDLHLDRLERQLAEWEEERRPGP